MSEFFKVPEPYNEPVKTYEPNSSEKNILKQELANVWNSPKQIPMYIGGTERISKELVPLKAPHMHKHILAMRAKSELLDIKDAISAALAAKSEWSNLRFEDKVAIYLRAANFLTNEYRQKMNAATMLGQSKNVYQSEIDAVCELADFLRYNVKFAEHIYEQQPNSVKEAKNTVDYRPLEGFVYALSPFNFTSIAGNLATAPALMGNTVVWKPSNQSIYSASVIMEVLNKAGMPPGVINLIYPSGPEAAKIILNHPDFAGIHFTGSTEVFQSIWQQIGNNITRYNSYPRIVGETGGKDFVMVHESADSKAVAAALTRGAFEYQGQKCSAASRAYIPSTRWEEIKNYMLAFTNKIKVGSPDNFKNFMCAVIDEPAFDKITGFIERARKSDNAKMIWDGAEKEHRSLTDKSEGYFVYPTIIETKDPFYESMRQEIFGPVLSIFVYNPKDWDETLFLVDKTSQYALTGSIFATDRYVIESAQKKLRYSAGNFYINDKPTGAVVGQQPFGGARASGTNDKAGSPDNLRRWVSPRAIKETYDPPKSPWYPHMSQS